MKSTILLGYTNKREAVTVDIDLNDNRLSIVGEVGNHGGGQNYDHLNITNYSVPNSLVERLIEIWKRWHLNDMRPGCIHQKDWDTQSPVVIRNYTWSTRFFKSRTEAESGEMSEDTYAQRRNISKAVYAATINSNRPQWKSDEIIRLLNDGWIIEESIEVKPAGWVNVHQHPEGMLLKPCPVCGNKYGSSWISEPLPQDVIEFIRFITNTYGVVNKA